MTRQPSRRIALHLLLAALLVLISTCARLAGPVAAATPFVDVSPNDPAAVAIDQLYARGVIKGYPTTPPTFGPDDTSLRAQMAALIGRGMGWSAGGTSPFTDRCDGNGCIDPELWGYVTALASRNVAKGYDATTFGPFDNVLKQQVILFISRAKVSTGAWEKQPDNPRIYPGAAGNVSDHQDIVTYVHYAGAPPDAPTTLDTAWDEYGDEATRGWFARALWQAYPEGVGTPIQTEPSPTPSPSASPSAKPSPSASPSPTPSPSPNPPGFAEQVLTLTNAQRQQHGCAALTLNPKLQNAAQKHAADMALQDYFSHTGLNGSTPDQRMVAEGYLWSWWAENIAAGQATPADVMDTWMNSPDHRANILNCNLTEIGIGYYYLANDTGVKNYHHYWVQVFGTPQ